MNSTRKIVLLNLFCILFFYSVDAQKIVGVKTNIPHWATVTPNIGIEVAFWNNMTFELSGGYNPFEFGDGQQWKHWIIWPEVRYWFWEPFNGHFLGLHGVFAEFNVGGLNLPFDRLAALKDRRYQGAVNGVGLSYGYTWIVGNSLLLEVTGGAGYGRLNYDVFSKGKEGFKINEGRKHYFGPTKGAVSVAYVF
ncbi:MAG: DUF3575 domain-containing protein [Petrimonas sp.]|nr:DUF3575 domain-containing protein [Petrimonas sp.]MDD3541345.1 DUF3575 domain-containing protein [Petrimonas sp.]MDD4014416.1 DUF3575 domain-containing protein [Petrimonas sp.]MDD4535415.1 DUF3575 domain-containing protein [Petrimonas sp.]MDD4844979.1 DUF3575 domain-containing protein [Petrimonas sp.]